MVVGANKLTRRLRLTLFLLLCAVWPRFSLLLSMVPSHPVCQAIFLSLTLANDEEHLLWDDMKMWAKHCNLVYNQ